MTDPTQPHAVLQALTLGQGIPLVQTLAAEAFMLVSWWKAIILYLPMIPWAWFVSTVLDKHAARFHMPRQTWGAIHLSVGTVAFLVAFLLPVASNMGFLASFGVMLVLLSTSVFAHILVANKDDRVPPAHRITINSIMKLTDGKKKKKDDKKTGTSELIIRQPDKQVLGVPAAETPEFELRTAAEQVVIRGMTARAAQIELVPASKEAFAVNHLVDGMKTKAEDLPAADAARIIDFWKTAAKLDLNERRKRQSADTNIERGVDKKKLRVTTMGSQAGQKLTLVFDPEAAVRRKPEQLGLLEPQIEELKSIINQGGGKGGLILLSSPAQQGRTTTMYAAVRLHDSYTSNVQTVELDIQDALEGVRQNKFDPYAEGAEFSTLLRSILRRDPDVVSVAELLDQNTAKEICRADLERTRVYVSLRAENAMQAVQLWMKTVDDAELATKPLAGAIANKLIRKLCVNCRTAYQPSPEMLKKLGLPADKVKQLYKKGGQVLIKNKPEICPVCNGGGYVGQEGVFEICAFTPEDRAMLKAGNFNAVRAELRKRQSPSIQQAALRKAIDGITSVEEVLRVTADPQAAAQPAAKPAAGAAPAKPAAPKNPS
jgi:type II secretory ATPase GspE/PulE/Tfp pilus assembly ATPase PilB-like protein